MAKRNRKTLAATFTSGKLPTEEAFSDLIDSMVNVVDDGFDKTAKDGLKVAQIGNDAKLISFYDEITVKVPIWSVGFSTPSYGQAATAPGRRKLGIYAGIGKTPAFTLTSEPQRDDVSGDVVRVGINVAEPTHALHVEGTISASGRLGRAGSSALVVRADGKWHRILEDLDGCHAYEVTAGVGKKQSGRYALMHAFAMSTFNSKKSGITYHQAYYGSRCDQIELRWVGTTHNYALEMRSRCSYEKNEDDRIEIRYYLTNLWFDPFMEGSSGSSPTGTL
jgi:hypothetical protein